MARATNSKQTRDRRRKVLNKAEGYYGSKHTLFKTANEQLLKSESYAYRDRRNRKRDIRRLWISRINAAVRLHDMKYSDFMHGLKRAEIDLNRKMLSELAIHDKDAFEKLITISKKHLV